MLSARNFRRLALSLALLALFACARGPSFQEYLSLLNERAGANSKDCGVVRLTQPHSGAVSCAQAALKDRTPFMVVFQVQGIDSEIFHGLAVNARGNATRLRWDSDAYGGGHPFATRSWVKKEACPQPFVSMELHLSNADRRSPAANTRLQRTPGDAR
jgi:hypothetical protein